MRFIGDIHGNIAPYLNCLSGCKESIQVGDFGMGFGDIKHDYVDEILGDVKGNHRFIRGNHDSPAECAKSKHWIADGHAESGMMFVGGADSIDKKRRTEGVSWWRDEELSYSALIEMIDKYHAVKPRVMVTHDAPAEIIARAFNCYDANRTRAAFDTMLGVHRPDIWIFGHWHRRLDQRIGGTRFICLAELEFIDLEI